MNANDSNFLGNIVFSYDNVGSYFLTLANAFPETKTCTSITINFGGVGPIFQIAGYEPPDVLQILTEINGTLANGCLYNTPIEIRVYP